MARTKRLTEKEIREGFEAMAWFRNHGHELIALALNPTWPKKESEVENGK